MRTTALLIAILVSLVVAGGAPAAKRLPVPVFPNIPGKWSHAEINVTIARTPHTLILDRGHVKQVTRTILRVLEGDGSVVSIPVSPATKVEVDGARGRVGWLNTSMDVETLRIDGGTALRIRATSTG